MLPRAIKTGAYSKQRQHHIQESGLLLLPVLIASPLVSARKVIIGSLSVSWLNVRKVSGGEVPGPIGGNSRAEGIGLRGLKGSPERVGMGLNQIQEAH